MKDRQVKKLILEKANLVTVPNLTNQIKARFDEIPPKPERKPVYRPRHLVEVMAFSMTLLIVATLAILYSSRETDPFVSTDDSLHEAVMLSSISTVSIIDDATTTVSSSDQIVLLAFGPTDEPDEDTEVTTNVDGVRHYLKLMESVLASDESYQYQRQVVNRRQRKFALAFRAMSLTDEETDYDLSYQVTDDNDLETTLSATITEGGVSYQSEIKYNKQTKEIIMTTALPDDASIEISFNQDEEGTHYQITRYDGLTMVEQVEMSYQTKAQVTLSFEHGTVFGTYNFSLDTDTSTNRRMISIDYDIQDTFSGHIQIRVVGVLNGTYEITITPAGRSSFTIYRTRGNGRN